MPSTATLDHPVISNSEWQRACGELLLKEKELTRQSEELSRLRRELPWTRVEKQYVFDSPQGPLSLSDLFNGRSQLATYHFMFGPEWTEGCPGCSYVTDHINGTLEHLRARDLSLVLVSRGPLDRLLAFKRRMGWHLPWVSSAGSDFNHDFGVSFSKQEVQSGVKSYNFNTTVPHDEENPGISFFSKDSSGEVFHTYSTYGRGLESLMTTYAILDRSPKGRDEADLKPPMAWVRHHDKYEPTLQVAESCCHNKASH